jgi:hypothetical protein
MCIIGCLIYPKGTILLARNCIIIDSLEGRKSAKFENDFRLYFGICFIPLVLTVALSLVYVFGRFMFSV